jgi:hypothetical protein
MGVLFTTSLIFDHPVGRSRADDNHRFRSSGEHRWYGRPASHYEGNRRGSAGNVLFRAGGFTSYSVLRLDGAIGLLTTAAGNGTPGFRGDGGPAADAQLNLAMLGLTRIIRLTAPGAIWVLQLAKANQSAQLHGRFYIASRRCRRPRRP